ncbi:MAG: HD domain-containing protein [Conexivisphaerales archaeon]
MRSTFEAERPIEIRDPIHGFVKVRPAEIEVVDTSFFQRLRRIRQLSCAYMAYPGANHTRFEHSLGTMHIAGLTAAILIDKGYLDEDGASRLRVAGLLHDVGHGPFSHLFEELLHAKTGITHEDMSSRIVAETEVGEALAKGGFDRRKMASLAVGREPGGRRFMNEVVAGTLSADLMDYLIRDSYYTGAGFGRVDINRIIDSFEVVDNHLAIESDAVHSFEALTVARYEMFKAVYFHKTCRAAEAMVLRAMQLVDDELGLTDMRDLSRYAQLDDEGVIYRILSLKEGTGAKKARELVTDFRERRLPKCVYEKMVIRRDGFVEKLLSKASVRADVVEEIANLAGVNPENVYVDVPTTPSVPFTSEREKFTELTIVSRGGPTMKKTKFSLAEIPAVAAISGFMDILRIYTTAKNRSKVEAAASKVLGESGYTTKISV